MNDSGANFNFPQKDKRKKITAFDEDEDLKLLHDQIQFVG